MRGSPVIIIPNYCGNEAALGFRDHNLSETVWLPERCHTWTGREIARIVHGENIIHIGDGDAAATIRRPLSVRYQVTDGRAPHVLSAVLGFGGG